MIPAPPVLPRRALLLSLPALLAGALLAVRTRDGQDPLPAPSLAVTPSVPPRTHDSCTVGPRLAGCWLVTDIAAFIESGLLDITGVERLSYVAAQGTLAFTFSPDPISSGSPVPSSPLLPPSSSQTGAVRIVADGYRVAVAATLRLMGQTDTAVTFDGELNGRYALAGDTLSLTGLARKDLVITVKTPLGAVGIDNDDVFAGGASRLVPSPDGATLSLFPDPANPAAITLTRERQVPGS